MRLTPTRPSRETPRASTSSYSWKNWIGSRTTPFPSRHRFSGWRIPEGIWWRMNSSSPT